MADIVERPEIIEVVVGPGGNVGKLYNPDECPMTVRFFSREDANFWLAPWPEDGAP